MHLFGHPLRGRGNLDGLREPELSKNGCRDVGIKILKEGVARPHNITDSHLTVQEGLIRQIANGAPSRRNDSLETIDEASNDSKKRCLTRAILAKEAYDAPSIQELETDVIQRQMPSVFHGQVFNGENIVRHVKTSVRAE